MCWSRAAVGGHYPEIFRLGRRFIPLIATGASTWISIHDRLREWTRIEQDRHPSPSESIIDSQSVKSAAGVSQQVGFDSGKLIKGRKRFLSVDTLGLVLRVFVTAASVPEREGGKRVLRRVKRMDKSLCRLTTIWVDGGFGAPF